VPLILSASQISTWLECKRKWGWRYLAGIKAEPHASAAFGTRVHSQLEAHLCGRELNFTDAQGEPDDSAHIAAAGLYLLPAPMTPGLRTEEQFRFTSPSGIQFMGYKDWSLTDSADVPILPDEIRHEQVDGQIVKVPAIQLSGGVPAVGDHKTTSSLRWAKTPEDLLTDPQAILYATDEIISTGASAVDLFWHYFQTRGAKTTKRVHLRVHQEHVEKRFSELDRLGRDEIAPILDSRYQVLDLPPSPGACENYGGCPHQSRCNLSPLERLRSVMSMSTMLANIKARQAAEATPAQLSAEQSTPTTAVRYSESWAQPPAPAPEEFAAGVPMPDGTTRPLWTFDPRGTPTGFDRAEAVRIAKQALATPINPPERQPAPAPASAPAQVTTEVKLTVAPSAPEAAAKVADALRTEAKAQAAGAAQVLAGTEPVQPKRGPGRPRKDKTSNEQGAVTAPAPSPDGFTLYVDCVPMCGYPAAHMLADYVARAQPVIKEATKSEQCPEGCDDYRFAPYGQGSGMLSRAVVELAKTEGRDLIVDTRTPEGAACVSALEATAGRVVRGLR
jgi:hypothetical protein